VTTIYQFPAFWIESQLFHAPGAGYDGGLTAGGAQFITPEPGGFGTLEMEIGVSDTQWDDPSASWIMSKIGGQIFRIRLSATPQVAYSRNRAKRIGEDWTGDFDATFTAVALKGSTEVKFDLTGVGPIVKPGHVIGHAFDTYMVDEINYVGNVATATVSPPVRRDIAVNDDCLLRPWFTGRISNGADVRSLFNNMGHVKPGKVIMQEAIV